MKHPIHYGTNILASAIYCENTSFILHKRDSKFLYHFMEIKMCSANIIRAKRKNFQNLKEFENLIKENLITSPITHCDETRMKIKT